MTKTIAVIACLTSSLALAQNVPGSITFNARLTDTGGAPVTGAHAMGFGLYSSASGGAAVWTENVSGATFSPEGVAYLELGAVTPLTTSALDGSKLYLEVSVDGTTMSPRLSIVSVPYAIRASVAATAASIGSLTEAAIQRRVTGTCSAGQAVRSIDAAGGVQCENLPGGGGVVTQVNTAMGSGLQGGGSGALALGLATCANGQVLMSNGAGWACSTAVGPAPSATEIQTAINGIPNLNVPNLGGRPAAGYLATVDFGRILEGEATPLDTSVTLGAVVTDTTGSGGRARKALFGDTTGRLWAVSAATLGEPVATRGTSVEFRLKVLTNTSANTIVTLGCSAQRAGAGASANLATRSVSPSQFTANAAWQSFRLDCEFLPDDTTQMVWVDYTTGLTDLTLDVVRLVPNARAFEGFSVFSTGTPKATDWAKATFTGVKFNTMGGAWKPATSSFVAPFAGYYRMSAGGYSATPTNSPDARVALGFAKNGALDSFSGGQTSVFDSPFPAHTQVMQLAAGDLVEVDVFSTQALTMGSGGGGHQFWWQGEYLGH